MRQFCTITIRDFITSCSWQVCRHASPSKFYNGRPRLPDEPAVFHANSAVLPLLGSIADRCAMFFAFLFSPFSQGFSRAILKESRAPALVSLIGDLEGELIAESGTSKTRRQESLKPPHIRVVRHHFDKQSVKPDESLDSLEKG